MKGDLFQELVEMLHGITHKPVPSDTLEVCRIIELHLSYAFLVGPLTKMNLGDL